MAVSKRLRFEVLKRDNHTCRYCGRSAPEVKLTVDHVTPVALGGADQPANLVTACADCNSGKSSVPADAATITDVQQDAIRWAAAIRTAADTMLADIKTRTKARAKFKTKWNACTREHSYLKKPVPLPATWGASVDTFLAAGLPMRVLEDCVERAAIVRKVASPDLFRYMCGIAWSRVTELQSAAGVKLGTKQVDAKAASVPEFIDIIEASLNQLDYVGLDKPLLCPNLGESDDRAKHLDARSWRAANNVHQLMNMASTITGMIVHLLEMLPADMVVAARQHAKELLGSYYQTGFLTGDSLAAALFALKCLYAKQFIESLPEAEAKELLEFGKAQGHLLYRSWLNPYSSAWHEYRRRNGIKRVAWDEPEMEQV